MSRILLVTLAVSLTLAACASAPIVQRVEVPVPVSCVHRDQVPRESASQFAATPRAAPLDAQVRALLIDRESGRTYTAKLRAIVEACIQAAPDNSTASTPAK